LEFTGNEKMVLEARNTNILTKQIELVTLTGVDFVTQQGSLQNSNNNARPSNATSFGSSVANTSPVQTPQQSQPAAAPAAAQAASPTPAPTPAPQPSASPIQQTSNVDVHAGADPVIPGLDTIDWENDFPTFG